MSNILAYTKIYALQILRPKYKMPISKRRGVLIGNMWYINGTSALQNSP